MITHLKTIPTKDSSGQPNGIVCPIWHVDTGQKIEQVYMTTLTPGNVKGPHLHFKREGAFTCIAGNVLIVYRIGSDYREVHCNASEGFKTVRIPPGVPCALYNVGFGEALILNMPNPGWRDNSDENTVTDWHYQPKVLSGDSLIDPQVIAEALTK